MAVSYQDYRPGGSQGGQVRKTRIQ